MKNPEIHVVNQNEWETEPARQIGEIFANKVMIQPIVAAVVALLAQAFSFTVDNTVVDNITLVVTFTAMIYAAWSANREQSQKARAQAEETRNAVYAPATVQRIAEKAAATGVPDVDPPPADHV